MTNTTNRLSQIETEIKHLEPYAKLVARLGIDISVTHGHGINQGHVDRARQFCELVRLRSELEA